MNSATPKPVASRKKRAVSNVVKFPVKRARAAEPRTPWISQHRDEELDALEELLKIASGGHDDVQLEADDVPGNVVPIFIDPGDIAVVEGRAVAQRFRASAAQLRASAARLLAQRSDAS